MPNLRYRLRTETRSAHDRVDAIFSDCDLDAADGLAAFLAAHRDAFDLLAHRSAESALAVPLRKAVDDIRADLKSLGIPPPVADLSPPPEDHPLARAYLWHGSRLGTRVISRSVGGAGGRYLGGEVDMAGWKQLCDELSATPATGAGADRVVAAAQAWFDVFAMAGRRHLEQVVRYA